MYAIRNAFGHLSDVLAYRAFVETKHRIRADASTCDIVEVDVIVRGVVSPSMPAKGKKK
jgi:hypothetical protein